MNQTDTNKRIAEATKWDFHAYDNSHGGKFIPIQRGTRMGFMPAYTESLDAIREAVLSQDEEFQDAFDVAMWRKWDKDERRFFEFSAADWCAAFLAVVEGRGE